MASDTTKLTTQEPQPLTPTEQRARVAPPVDVYENADEILLYADMPGVDGNALELSFERGQLTLSARRDSEQTVGICARNTGLVITTAASPCRLVWTRGRFTPS